jgi:hypothetical protein
MDNVKILRPSASSIHRFRWKWFPTARWRPDGLFAFGVRVVGSDRNARQRASWGR